ncbi:MAG: ABC transporter permease [Candidatus Methanomethylophilaceae archaeon]
MRDGVKIALAFAPVIVILALFFLWPLCETIRASVCRGGEFIGLERFADFLSDREFIDAFLFSTEIAILSTAISVISAVVISLALRDTFVGKRISVFLYQTNISIPHIAMATMVIFMFSPTGWFSALSYQMGWIDNWYEFPDLAKGDSMFGVVFSFVLKFTPFIGLAVLAVLQSLSRDYEDQSRSLGVGRMKTFLHVTLPAILPAIVSTSMIVFAYSFGCYEVPNVLVRRTTLSMLVYNRYYDFYNPDCRPEAFAAALVIAAVTLTVSVVYLYVTGRKSR